MTRRPVRTLLALASALLPLHAAGAQSRVILPGPPHSPFPAPAPVCGRWFDAPLAHKTGANPATLAFADLNGDQEDDLVVADIGSDEICVFLARGGGSFRTRVEYDLPVDSDPRAVAVVDATGDGRRDVVVLLRATRQVHLLRGVGDGTLLPSIAIDTMPSGSSNDLAAGDIDADGDLDVVLSVIGGNGGLRVVRNDGPAGWAGADVPSLFPLDAPQSLVLADLDGDLDLDVALPSSSSTSFLRVYPNPGDGSFSAWNAFPAGDRVVRIRAGDADADGDLDLFVVHARIWPAPGAFSVLVNNGSGAFRNRVEHATGSEPFHLDVGDIDSDGLVDVVVACEGTDNVHLHTNAGGLNFVPNGLFRVDLSPWDVVIHDVDGDGVQDVAVCANAAEAVFVFLAAFPGGWLFPVIEPTVGPAWGSVAGDLTGDGLPEAVVAHTGQNEISVLSNQGGVLGPASHHPWTPYPHEPKVFDFDGDGQLDVLALDGLGYGGATLGHVIWLRNTGGGVLAPAVGLDLPYDMRVWAIGDLDQDGDADLVTARSSSPSGITSFWNQGGTFTSVPVTAPPANCGEIQIVDLDGDGLLDVAYSLWEDFPVATDPQGLYVQRNLGAGVLAPMVQVTNPVPTVRACYGVLAEDVDLDGDVDLVAGPKANQAASSAIPYVAYNHGGGVFTPRFVSPAPPYPSTDMALADLDHDGIPELLLTGIRGGGGTPTTSVVMVYRRNGAGDHELEWTYVLGTFATEIVAADFDVDGDMDLLLPPRTDNRPLIKMQNRCR